MEEIPNDVEVVIKTVSNKGMIIQDTKEIIEKGEEIKTTEYYLNVEDHGEEDGIEGAQFVTVDNDCDGQFVAVEVSDSGQIILPDKDVILWNEICRICANGSDKEFISIFDGEGLEHDLGNKIHTYLPLRVSENDTLPLQVCYNCAATLIAWHEIFKGCLDAQQRLVDLQSKLNLKDQYYNDPSVEEENIETVLEVETINNEESQIQPKDEDTVEMVQIIESNRSASIQPSKTDIPDIQIIKPKASIEKPTATSERADESSDRWMTVADFARSPPDPLDCTSQSLDVDSSSSSSIDSSKKPNPIPKLKTKAKGRKAKKNSTIESHVCPECGKIFGFKDSLTRHLRIHNDERPFTCHVCGKQFRDSGGLCRHLRDVHARLKNFTCDTCGRSFASKATRDDHERIHTGERPYVCDTCGKSFKTKASLYTHSKTHTDAFPHPCAYCERRFRRRQELLSHLSTHTGEKKFECDVCSRRFRVKLELRRHTLSHSEEKPFACDICDFRCKQRRYLNNHVRHKHSLIEKKEETDV